MGRGVAGRVRAGAVASELRGLGEVWERVAVTTWGSQGLRLCVPLPVRVCRLGLLGPRLAEGVCAPPGSVCLPASLWLARATWSVYVCVAVCHLALHGQFLCLLRAHL